jgi:hypothetical protein
MLSLITGFVITIISGLLFLGQKWKENKKSGNDTKKETGLFAILVIGSLITFYSGCNSYFSLLTHQKELKRKDSLYAALLLSNNSKADSLKDSITSAKKQLLILQGENQFESNRLRDSLNKARTQIIKVQQKAYRELNNQETGGGTRPHFYPMQKGDAISFAISNPGNYAIPDIIISFVDYYEVKRDGVDQQTNLSKYLRSNNIGTLGPHVVRSVFKRPIPKDWDGLQYTFDVFYKTGGYTWYVAFKRNEKGEFKPAESKYIDHSTNKYFTF